MSHARQNARISSVRPSEIRMSGRNEGAKVQQTIPHRAEFCAKVRCNMGYLKKRKCSVRLWIVDVLVSMT
jgi:hypothetical protein